MKTRDRVEHFISQVLLRRFTVKGHFQSYDVLTNTWRAKGTRKVFAFKGWNQLLVNGQADNTLEEEFCRTERNLPRTFRALEQALANSCTELPLTAYENLSKYCAFIWYLSPFAKANCLVNLLTQMDFDLQKGNDKLLLELGCPAEMIPPLRAAHAKGKRFILKSPDILQLIYRFQIARSYAGQFSIFFNSARWGIWASPIEFPISDIALVQIHFPQHKATVYFLPIAPKTVVSAKLNTGPQTNDHRPRITTGTLSVDEAEYYFDATCLSAVNELVSSKVIPNVQSIRSRAWSKGIRFPKIVEPMQYAGSGLKETGGKIEFQMASESERIAFIHQFLLPAGPPT